MRRRHVDFAAAVVFFLNSLLETAGFLGASVTEANVQTRLEVGAVPALRPKGQLRPCMDRGTHLDDVARLKTDTLYSSAHVAEVNFAEENSIGYSHRARIATDNIHPTTSGGLPDSATASQYWASRPLRHTDKAHDVSSAQLRASMPHDNAEHMVKEATLNPGMHPADSVLEQKESAATQRPSKEIETPQEEANESLAKNDENRTSRRRDTDAVDEHESEEEDSLSASDDPHLVEHVFFRDHQDTWDDPPVVSQIVASDLDRISALKCDAATVSGWKQPAGRLRWLEVCMRQHRRTILAANTCMSNM
jgi:hypothetical protein